MPVRVVIGPRDLEGGHVELARRDTSTKENIPQEGLADHVAALMDEIQRNLYAKALKFRDENIR